MKKIEIAQTIKLFNEIKKPIDEEDSSINVSISIYPVFYNISR